LTGDQGEGHADRRSKPACQAVQFPLQRIGPHRSNDSEVLAKATETQAGIPGPAGFTRIVLGAYRDDPLGFHSKMAIFHPFEDRCGEAMPAGRAGGKVHPPRPAASRADTVELLIPQSISRFAEYGASAPHIDSNIAHRARLLPSADSGVQLNRFHYGKRPNLGNI